VKLTGPKKPKSPVLTNSESNENEPSSVTGFTRNVVFVSPGSPQYADPTAFELIHISPTSSVLQTDGEPSILRTTNEAEKLIKGQFVLVKKKVVEILLPPGKTWPQSCRVREVKEFSWSTRTTPWLRPDIDNTPLPVALAPSLPGLRMATVSPSAEAAQGHIASGLKPFD